MYNSDIIIQFRQNTKSLAFPQKLNTLSKAVLEYALAFDKYQKQNQVKVHLDMKPK